MSLPLMSCHVCDSLQYKFWRHRSKCLLKLKPLVPLLFIGHPLAIEIPTLRPSQVIFSCDGASFLWPRCLSLTISRKRDPKRPGKKVDLPPFFSFISNHRRCPDPNEDITMPTIGRLFPYQGRTIQELGCIQEKTTTPERPDNFLFVFFL